MALFYIIDIIWNNRIMGLYIVFISILFIIYFLFAYDLKLKVSFDFYGLKVKVFLIPIIILKKEKFHRFLNNLIPKNKTQMMKGIDTTFLLNLVHFKKLDIQIYKDIQDYFNYLLLNESLYIINTILLPLIISKIDFYHYQIQASEINNIKVNSIITFNLGIILLNLYVIKRRYKHVQKTD
jgi:hypothetical protein